MDELLECFVEHRGDPVYVPVNPQLSPREIIAIDKVAAETAGRVIRERQANRERDNMLERLSLSLNHLDNEQIRSVLGMVNAMGKGAVVSWRCIVGPPQHG